MDTTASTGRGLEAEPRRPAGAPQVHVDEAQPGDRRVAGPAERERDRVRVDRDDGRRGQPPEQPHRERSGAAAQVEDERVRPPGAASTASMSAVNRSSRSGM